MDASPLATTKVLIVEDEPIIALDIRQRLRLAGYQVVAIADSAETALAATARWNPDVILMDIRINGDVNGIETAEQIRAEFQLPIVFLTAHADRATLEQAKMVKPFGYIVKPFETHDLVTSLEVALSRHQAEQAIAQALLRERELNQLKSQFVSVVSHEFRTPLSVIAMSLDVVARYVDPTAERAHRSLKRANNAISQLEQLIEEVTVLEQTNEPKIALQPEALLLSSFCQDVLAEIQCLGSPQHQFEFRVAGVNLASLDRKELERMELAYLDASCLRHTLSNLLINAIKYSPDGGLIQLELEFTPFQVFFRVMDQGLGIPKADQPKLFDRFYRASNAGTIDGTGLGLSIVHQCVTRHGGEILIESTLGQGTCFTVVMPRDCRQCLAA